SGFLHIVIMDPALPWGRASFDESILHEHSVGDRLQWDADYARFARDKARICWRTRSEEHTSELQSRENLVCRLLLEKKKIQPIHHRHDQIELNISRDLRGQELVPDVLAIIRVITYDLLVTDADRLVTPCRGNPQRI